MILFLLQHSMLPVSQQFLLCSFCKGAWESKVIWSKAFSVKKGTTSEGESDEIRDTNLYDKVNGNSGKKQTSSVPLTDGPSRNCRLCRWWGCKAGCPRYLGWVGCQWDSAELMKECVRDGEEQRENRQTGLCVRGSGSAQTVVDQHACHSPVPHHPTLACLLLVSCGSSPCASSLSHAGVSTAGTRCWLLG